MTTGLYITGLYFAHPWWLALLVVIPVWFLLQRRFRRDIYPSVRFPDLSAMHATGHNQRAIWPVIVRISFFTTLFLLIVAMARPQLPMRQHGDHTEGIDIMLTMDISLSMLARDFYPDRLEASKDVAARFINQRGPDRIGLVVFAGQTFTLCPLTADKAALITLLQQAQAGFIEDGSTAIGDGIATAINRLRDSKAKSRVIILLTDGENNAGNIDPLQAAEIASLFGIRLYTIGVGSQGTAIGPVQILDGNLIFGPVEVNIDEGTLRKAAEMADGKYFRAEDENALLQIYGEIDQLEKSRLEITEQHARLELFPWFILTAMLLMFANWMIRYLFVKMIP